MPTPYEVSRVFWAVWLGSIGVLGGIIWSFTGSPVPGAVTALLFVILIAVAVVRYRRLGKAGD